MNNINKFQETQKENIQPSINNTINNKKEQTNPNTNIIIKKPIMSESEYENMMKKRILLKKNSKNSKYRPMTLLFGKRKQLQNNNYTISLTNPNINNINNSNIQINNYTTYLTSIETIVEEKYQNDGQTLIVENPNYSMKQLYKTSLLNKITIIYIRKINELEDIYNFTNEYLSFIIKIFEKLCQPFITSLSDIFVNSIKPNLIYFHDISIIYNDFSEKIKNININIQNTSNKLPELLYTEGNLNDSVKKINSTYSETFGTTSKNIQSIIINNPLFIKIDTIVLKFNEIYNKMMIYINKLNHRLNKYNDKFKKDALPYFNKIKQGLNDPNLYRNLSLGKDFIFYEQDLLFYSNKIYSKISQFLLNMDLLFKEAQNIFYDYLELLNNTIKLYYTKNMNILNMATILNNKAILKIENLLKLDDIRKYIEEKFSFNNIIEKNKNEKLFNDINHFLLNYRDLLLQNNYVKNDDIEEVINFNLINYNSSTNFIQFLLKLIPQKFLFKYKDIIELKINAKRNSGLIKGWKNCLIVITYQGHILIFDKDVGDITQIPGKVRTDSGTLSGNKKMTRKEIINSIIVEDEKKVEKKINEYEDLYEAIKNNKLVGNYWRSNFGMVKLNNKDNKKLVAIYEDYMGFRQYKYMTLDILTEENLNILINTLNKNKII